MWIFLCSCQCCADLGWMVSVVINDCDAVYLALVLETSVSTAKFVKACEDRPSVVDKAMAASALLTL